MPPHQESPDVVAGFTRSGHLLGNERKEAEDPLQSGKKLGFTFPRPS